MQASLNGFYKNIYGGGFIKFTEFEKIFKIFLKVANIRLIGV